ncbi:hypothetical protein Aperf_G00000095005 [Anoplocephala perfoliata]
MGLRDSPEHWIKYARKKALEAALLIQSWYRRHQAELEMRRRCAWKIYEFFEYTGADDQRQILDSDLVSEVLEEATAILQAAPNIQKVSTALFHRITICGDLHGQMEDLALIFRVNGLPDIFNPYIFNGDFVDRGSNSVEKQSKKILKQIETLFCAIPLCTVLDDVILVCHGGFSRTTDLSMVAKIDRKMFPSILQPPLEGENAVAIDDWRQASC